MPLRSFLLKGEDNLILAEGSPTLFGQGGREETDVTDTRRAFSHLTWARQRFVSISTGYYPVHAVTKVGRYAGCQGFQMSAKG